MRLYWRNVPLIAVPTAVIYPVGGRSNFRMLADNALITKLHAKLDASACCCGCRCS